MAWHLMEQVNEHLHRRLNLARHLEILREYSMLSALAVMMEMMGKRMTA
jgi:hypothetical protein